MRVDIIELGGGASSDLACEKTLGGDTGNGVGGDSVPGIGIGVVERVLAEEDDECDDSSSETATPKPAENLKEGDDATAS